MNYPCPRELAYLPDGVSRESDDTTIFMEAVGAFVIECTNLNWHMICPSSARFREKYAFRAGWGNKARFEASHIYYAPMRGTALRFLEIPLARRFVFFCLGQRNALSCMSAYARSALGGNVAAAIVVLARVLLLICIAICLVAWGTCQQHMEPRAWLRWRSTIHCTQPYGPLWPMVQLLAGTASVA